MLILGCQGYETAGQLFLGKVAVSAQPHSPRLKTGLTFMDLILMMGIAGPENADYVDQLDLYHTREMFMTWYPNKNEKQAAAAEQAAAVSGGTAGPVAVKEGVTA
jgi:hypothetical protein